MRTGALAVELLIKHFSGLESGLTASALRYAIGLSASGLAPSSRLSQEWSGLSYFSKVRNFVHNLDEQLDLIIDKLQQLTKEVITLDQPHLVLSCDQEEADHLKREQFFGLVDLPGKKSNPWTTDVPEEVVPHQGKVGQDLFRTEETPAGAYD